MNNSNINQPKRTLIPIFNPARPRNYFMRAAVCGNGHVFSAGLEPDNDLNSSNYVPIPKYCQSCGADFFSDCPNCNSMIPGHFYSPYRFYPPEYQLHYFCGECSKPFPWAGQEQILMNLQNVLLKEIVDPALRMELKKRFAELIAEDRDASKRKLAALIKDKAGEVFNSPPVQLAITEAIKALFRSI